MVVMARRRGLRQRIAQHEAGDLVHVEPQHQGQVGALAARLQDGGDRGQLERGQEVAAHAVHQRCLAHHDPLAALQDERHRGLVDGTHLAVEALAAEQRDAGQRRRTVQAARGRQLHDTPGEREAQRRELVVLGVAREREGGHG
jgi:hypothetical protein